MEIRYVDHGLANRFDKHIEVNKHLKKYPQLLKPMLEHEFAHTDKVISWEDFKLDLIMPQTFYYKALFNFMIKHPRSFTQLLPIYWDKEKGFVYDINLGLMYSMMVIVSTCIIYFGLKYL